MAKSKAALAAVSMIIIVAVLYIAFRGSTTSRTTPSVANRTTPSDLVTTDQSPLPSVPISSIVAQLETDLSLGLDPRTNDWTSEAFNETALAQLKELSKLLQVDPTLGHARFSPVLADEFVCTALRPRKLERILEDETTIIRRMVTGVTAREHGRTEFAELIVDLPTSVSEQHHIACKIVRVELADSPRTQVRASGFGVAHGQPTEWTAAWDCVWNTDTVPPRLQSLRVVEYEEVTTKGDIDTYLVDNTAIVMGGAEGFRDQLLIGMNTWVNRLAHRLRINRLGHNGIAIGDVNGDGREDIYVCQPGGLPNRLYVQQPDGTVKDFSDEAGVNFLDDTTCALLVDLDNDGDQDLALVTVVAAIVLANDGTGRFAPKSVISECRNSFSLTAADFNNDRRLDLYVGRYWASDLARGEHPLPIPYFDANNGGRNILLQNEGDWKFTDVTDSVGLNANNSRFTMAAAWEDLDDDGDVDLYVANDFGRNCWYRNENGQFIDAAAQAGIEDIASGMSVSFADFDHDGQFDIYVSNMFSTAGQRTTGQAQYSRSFASGDLQKLQRLARGNTLFRKEPSNDNSAHAFADVSLAAKVNMGRWAWGSIFADVNNDSWDDLLVANGFLTTSDTGDM